MAATQVLVADDSPAFLAATQALLTGDPRLHVVATVSDGQQAVESIAQLQPDLVVMDLAMPRLDGLEATHRLKALPRGPRIIVVTMHDLPRYRRAALSAGADGFLTKSQFSTHIIPLIERLLDLP